MARKTVAKARAAKSDAEKGIALKAEIAKPELTLWQAENVRITVFPEPSPNFHTDGWWESVLGTTPETRSSQPKQGVVQETGPFLDGVMTLNVTPLRIDWLLSANFAKLVPGEGLPTIGAFPSVVEAFCAKVNSWFSQAPAIKRLAFGSVALQEVQSHEEAYQMLGRYLPAVTMDPQGSSEFIYRINRPRLSAVMPEMRVNRIMNWSAAKIQGVNMQWNVASGSRGNIVSGVPMREYFACRLELDISTPPDRTEPFAVDALPAVLGELVGLGLEIAAKGDTP